MAAPRSYKQWTAEEEEALGAFWREGWPMSVIVSTLNRNESSIHSKGTAMSLQRRFPHRYRRAAQHAR